MPKPAAALYLPIASDAWHREDQIENEIAHLALRTADIVNAVSRRHREIASKMWVPLWSGSPEGVVPVKAVTNGVHISTWIAPANPKLSTIASACSAMCIASIPDIRCP